ncbi:MULTISPECIES: RNA polymerase sigma-70 factor [unclassified Carboxylicivirga]|uniref:RNA polymerase sigma-70 factor n=1 Tax=Carboxylicivirga TaxID=1628153 RepID=UPI003D32B542
MPLLALKKGDKKSFEAIYLEYFDMLFHLSLGYTDDREVAHGIVQDTFVKLWERRHQLNPGTNLRNFLYTITKNNCLNYLRQQEIIVRNHRDYLVPELRYKQESLLDFADSFDDAQYLMKSVEQAIAKLPEHIRHTFLLSRYEDLTYAQIAEKLNLSPKTVEARMSKALKILRQELKEYLPLVQMLFGFMGL